MIENEPMTPESFEQKVLAYQNKIFRTAVAILKNVPEAEDITQETFIRLYEHTEPFENSEHEKAWLLRVTINLCKNKLRSCWWKRHVPLLESLPAPTPEEHDLLALIMTLPAKYRTVLHLFYYEGYSTKEIAAITGQKDATVRSLLSRARTKLKLQLETSESLERSPL